MSDVSHNYNFPISYETVEDLGQTPHIDIVVVTRLQYGSGWPNRYLSVNLAGTRVSADGVHTPPKMAHDDRDHRGWYTESVRVRMWLSDNTSRWEEEGPSEVTKGVFRTNDGPVTTGGSVTQTSGTSETLGANAGAMGEAPMVGISGGISMSTSFSEVIPHFSIVNNSNESSVSQMFYMTSSEGGGYKHGGDLMYRHDPFSQTSLRGIPEKALSGLEINSQAIWAAPSEFDEVVRLNVELTHVLANVWTTKSGIGKLDSDTHWQTKGFSFHRTVEVKFSELS